MAADLGLIVNFLPCGASRAAVPQELERGYRVEAPTPSQPGPLGFRWGNGDIHLGDGLVGGQGRQGGLNVGGIAHH